MTLFRNGGQSVAIVKVNFTLKTAVECARGFYISRRGAETRRFIRILKHLKRIAAFHPGGEDL